MKKRKLLFFLLTAVFTLLCAPPEAQAWDFGQNVTVQLKGSGYKYTNGDQANWQNVDMTWNSSASRYEIAITPTEGTVYFKFRFHNDDHGTKSAPELSTTDNPIYTSQFWNNEECSQSGLTSGTTYYIYVKPDGGNPTYAFCTAPDPDPDWDFSSNTLPKAIRINFDEHWTGNVDLVYNASDKIWAADFTPTSVYSEGGYVNFWVQPSEDGASFKHKYGEDKGQTSVNGEWTTNALTKTKHFFQGGLTANTKYRFELKADGNNTKKFQWHIIKASETVAMPTFSPAPGEVGANTAVTISCTTPGATIYYTIDGSDPTTESAQYSDSNKPVVTGECTIKAIAVIGSEVSDVASAAYTIKTPAENEYTVSVNLSRMGTGKWTASAVRAFYKKGSGSGESVDLNQWPGDEGTVNGDVVTFTFTSETKPAFVIFNNGNSGNGNQTIDLSFIDKHTYVLNAKEAENGYWKVDASQPVAEYNLPYGPNDFAEPKYFLVGPRMGMWRLQPEWELIKQADGSYKVDGGRFMFYGSFAVAKVENFGDYASHRYTIVAKSSKDGGVVKNGTTTISGMINKGSKTEKNPSYTNKGDASEVVMMFKYGKETNGDVDWAKVDNGVWCDAITLNSAANEISFTIGNDTEKASERVFTLVGQNIYNKSYASAEDNSGRKTPRGETGWQESWIQYGPNGRPYFDANKEYLYHTAYVPSVMNSTSVDFQIPLADGRPFPYTSKAVTFVEKDKLEGLDDDKYRDLYQYFITNPGAVASNTTVEGGKDETAFKFQFGTLPESFNAENASWQVYVIRDAWMKGEFKLWNGWGGNSINNEGLRDYDNDGDKNARWNNLSGGPQGTSAVAVKLTDINADNVAQEMNKVYVNEGVGGNWDAGSTITYYNRVILLYNTKEGKGLGDSYVLFIQDDTAPVIKAFLEGEENNKAYVEWNLQNVKAGSSAVITDYTITRYRVTDEGNMNPVVVKTEKDLNWKVTDLTAVTDKTTVHHDEVLNPGQYVYHIVVTYKDGEETGTREANSNRIRVFGSELYPEVRVEQLVALTDEGFTKEVKDALGVTTYAPNKYYLTYRDNSQTADYYVLSTTESDNIENVAYVAQIDTEAAREILADPLKYIWCARFYVRALDYTQYVRYYERQGLKYSLRPTITLTDLAANEAKEQGWKSDYTGAEIPTQSYQVHLADGTVNEYYGAFVDRSGLLLGGQMKAEMEYGYGFDAETENTAKHDHTVNFTPVVASPFDFGYKYEYRLEDFGNPVEEYLKAQKKVLSDDFKADITFKTTTSAEGFAGKVIEVSADESLINSERHLDCVISFLRPNLSNNILKNYDIYYTVSLTSEEADDLSDSDDLGNYKAARLEGTYYDVEQTSDVADNGAGKKRPYQVKISNTHPSGKIYPRFEITKVEYKRLHDGKVSDYSLTPNHIYKEMVVTAPNKPTAKTTVGDLKLSSSADTDSDNYNWFLEGHKDLVWDLNPDGENNVADQEQSPFFIFEIVGGTSHAYNTELWKHVHAEGASADANGFWMEGGDGFFPIGQLPEMDEDKKPSVYVTPVYLFHRQPTDEGMKGEAIIDLTKVESTPVAVIRRAGAANINADRLTVEETDGVVTSAKYDATPSEHFMLVKGQTAYVETPGSSIVTGIEEIISDGDAEAVYYNLQGIRVKTPKHGEVYIRVQGNTTEKVVF